MATTMKEADRLLTEQEAAKVLDLEPGTLRHWRCDRRKYHLRYIKVGGAVRYRLSDLLQWLERRTVE
jgi:excisionase family DNA binding protein